MAEVSTLIPKKGAVRSQFITEGGISIFMRLSSVVFVVAVLVTGVLYAWKSLAQRNVNEQGDLLKKLEVKFDPATIEELKKLANKISAAKYLLASHTKTSAVFDLLEKNTLPDVGYSSFAHAAVQHTVTLSGEAPSYTSVAAQTAIFESLPEVLSASFSNLSLLESGRVKFSIVITLKQ